MRKQNKQQKSLNENQIQKGIKCKAYDMQKNKVRGKR